jgi:hypothetical protein
MYNSRGSLMQIKHMIGWTKLNLYSNDIHGLISRSVEDLRSPGMREDAPSEEIQDQMVVHE